MSPPSHQTSCTPIKFNLYLDSALETAIRAPALYKLYFTRFKSQIHIPSLRPFTQRISPGLRLFRSFSNKFIFHGAGLLALRPTPKLEAHPLLFVWSCPFNIFIATAHTHYHTPQKNYKAVRKIWLGNARVFPLY